MDRFNENNQQQPNMLSLREITEVLIKHQGLHDGSYNLLIEFQIGVGAVGPVPESVLPGAMVGVSRIGLSKTDPDKNNIHTVDAAEVNPIVKPRKKKDKASSH